MTTVSQKGLPPASDLLQNIGGTLTITFLFLHYLPKLPSMMTTMLTYGFLSKHNSHYKEQEHAELAYIL